MASILPAIIVPTAGQTAGQTKTSTTVNAIQVRYGPLSRMRLYRLANAEFGMAVDTASPSRDVYLFLGSPLGNVQIFPVDVSSLFSQIQSQQNQITSQQDQIQSQQNQITSQQSQLDSLTDKMTALIAQQTTLSFEQATLSTQQSASSLQQSETTSAMNQDMADMTQKLEDVMSYSRTNPQLPHIQQDYIDASGNTGHQAVAATNPIPAPVAASGIDTTIVTFTPSAATQTLTLPSVASVVAASVNGIGYCQVKNMANIAYAGVNPAGSDTIDGSTGLFAPTNGDLGAGGLIIFTTVGTTGWTVG